MNKSVNRLAIAVSVLLLIFVFLVNQNPPINSIIVEHQISQEKVSALKVSSWLTWKKEPSTFLVQETAKQTLTAPFSKSAKTKPSKLTLFLG